MRLFGMNQLMALVLVSATLVARPSHAEDGPITSTPDVALPQLGAPQQQQQPQDRKEGAGAAAAMAAVGAAMAGMSCAMLLKQAQQEPDPSKAAVLRAQAMQQCAQAAQNAASAAQNDDSKNKLSMTDDPKVDLAYKPEVKDYRQSETKQAAANGAATSTEPPSEIADAGNDNAPPVEVFDQGPNIDWTAGDGDSRARGESISQLKPIENPALTFDEESKAGGTTPGAVTGPTTTSGFAMSGGFSNDALRQLASGTLDAVDVLKNGKGRKKSKLEVESHGDGAGGDSGHGHHGGGGEGGDVGSMLAKIMGGGGEEGALQSGAQLADVHSGKSAAVGKPAPNIFQYASYRFRKSKREGDLKKGRVAMVGKP